MVHRSTGRAGVRGDLILETERLVFRPELRTATPDVLGETVFALNEIEKVGRARGSAVLELRVHTAGVPRIVLFYFVRPPDIYSSGMPNPRFAGASYLMTSGALLAEEVQGWELAIRSGAERAKA